MAQTTLSIRMDETVKKQLDSFCAEIGINTSAAINMFAKTVIREQRIPFEIALHPDPFYSEANMKRLQIAAERMDKFGGTVHELAEVYDD